MPSSNKPRGRANAARDRAVRIEPTRQEQPDYRRLARALLRLAQSRYEPPEARASPPPDPDGGHDAPDPCLPAQAAQRADEAP